MPAISESPIRKRLLAIGVGLAFGIFVAVAMFYVAGVDVRDATRIARNRLSPPPPVPIGPEIFRPHPTRGAQTIPGGRDRHTTEEFDVEYSIDETGARKIQGNDYSKPIVGVYGDSFSFGHGVEDDETYGAVLHARHWPEHAVQNRAIPGWSMVPSALILDEDLGGDAPPSIVLYGWLQVHNERSFRFLHGSPAPFPPWLEKIKRELVDPYPESAASESEITRRVGHAVLAHMALRTRERGTPFWVIVLALPGSKPQREELDHRIPFLENEEVSVVDLQRHLAFSSRKGLQFPVDHHPTPEYHRRAARVIARTIGTPPSSSDLKP